MRTEGGADPRKVFVIHGRNERARRGLFEFLRAIGLDPIEWSEAIRLTGKGSPYIGQVLDAAFGAAQAVVVLQTPDDVAHLHESLAGPDDPECVPQMQPRPNVLFEAGMAMGRDEDRTIIVEMGRVKVFSDIHGRHVVRLDGTAGRRQELAQRLQTAGCAVQLTGTDWLGSGDLTVPATPGGLHAPERHPRIEARYIANGSGRPDAVEITNQGPGDILDVDVTGDDAGLMLREVDLPLRRLPGGKSFQVPAWRQRSFGSTPSSHFYLTITGRAEDGTPLTYEEFVSTH